jgi:site-specific DNA-methyltransferase (adenine-specific)
MTPYYEQDGIVIYHGECRSVMATFPECLRVDAVVTDPPYGIGFTYPCAGYVDSEDGYGEWMWEAISAAERFVASHGVVAVFQSAKHARRWPQWFPRDWRLIAIPKVFVQMNTSLLTWATDYVLYWPMADTPNGRQEWQPSPARDWFVSHETAIPRRGPERDHPCPRPEDMMRHIVSCLVPPSDIVLDPFMGSGTTLVAAKRLGRRAVGIEIEERYCEIAAKRLAQGALPLDMGREQDGAA